MLAIRCRLDPQIQRDILGFITERIATERIAIEQNPRRMGKALRGGLTGLWRYRLRDYRLVCQIKVIG